MQRIIRPCNIYIFSLIDLTGVKLHVCVCVCGLCVFYSFHGVTAELLKVQKLEINDPLDGKPSVEWQRSCGNWAVVYRCMHFVCVCVLDCKIVAK